MIERTIEHWRALPDLSLKEAGEVLGCAVGSVRGMVERGELEARRRAGRIMVTVESIRRMLGEYPESQEIRAMPIQAMSPNDIAAMRSLRGGR